MPTKFKFIRFPKRTPPVDSREAEMRTASWEHIDKQNAVQYEIAHEHVSNDVKMCVKQLHTKMHNMITIFIH